MSILYDWLITAAHLSFHAARACGFAAGGGGLRRAFLLSCAEGLVADGRRHFARGAARHRHRLCDRSAPCARRLRRGALLRAAHRLCEGQQPHQRGHGDGHRVLRHVRAGAGALHQDRDRPAPDAYPVRRRARRDVARSRRDGDHRRRHARHRAAQAARSPALLLRSEPSARHRTCPCACCITGFWSCSPLTIVAR